MADATVQGYDIIGDVHGCATQLKALLSELGYHKRSSTSEYRHPERQVIFVGDLIDRGDEQLRVLEIAKDMVDAGSARIVMGNHEFNALAYDTEWPLGSGKYLRAHDDPDNPWSAKNTKQHAAFLAQVTGADRRRFLYWFATIPLWLDLGGLRVVHACWHPQSISVVEEQCGSSTPFHELDHLVAAATEGAPLYQAVETLMKGPEISLVAHGQGRYLDKDVSLGATRVCGGGTARPSLCETSPRWVGTSPPKPATPTRCCPNGICQERICPTSTRRECRCSTAITGGRALRSICTTGPITPRVWTSAR